MHAQIGPEQFVHSRIAEPRDIGGGDDAVSVQSPERRIADERVQPELFQPGNTDGRKGPRRCDLFHLADERIGIAEVMRQLKQSRQVMQREVHGPICLGAGWRRTLNGTNGLDLILGNIPADDKTTKLMEESRAPKRRAGRERREFEREFVASAGVQLLK